MSKRAVSRRGLKVLWAVDAFHENPKMQLLALQTFLKMNGGAGASHIEPVAVLHPGSFDPVTESFPRNWRELAGAALGNVVDALERVAGAGVSPVRLLRVEKPTITASVDALLRFALREGVSLILVSSRSRKGFDRLAIGSFAETLVLRSPVPVFVTNPGAKAHGKLTTLLYPTDFSAASKKGFDRVLALARPFGLKICLYHKAPVPRSEPSFGMVLPPISRESLRRLKAETAAVAKDWARRGERCGVRTRFHIDVDGSGKLEAILKSHRKLGTQAMIAMTAQSGLWGASLLGSLTRQVLRSASCPVLVVHGDQPSLEKRFAEEVRRTGYGFSVDATVR